MLLFKDIKQNYPVYILNKNDLTIVTGKVVSTTFPHMDMSSTSYGNPSNTMIVDVTIEAGGKTATYAIPENLPITYANELVLSTDKEGLSREVEALRNTAEQILASVDHQKDVVEKSTQLLSELSPEYKSKQENEERFGKIENSISEMKEMLNGFINNLKNR